MILGARKLTGAARRFMWAGIFNVLAGLCVATALGALIVTIPMGLLVIGLGIWEIFNATLFWHLPPKAAWSPRHIAYLEIAAFLAGPIWNLAFGIINLTQLGDPDVRAYLDDLYKDDPLKPKKATRRMAGWMLVAVGGTSTLLAGLILLISSLAQFLGENPSENLQGYFLAMGICPAPALLIGLGMLAGGVYVLLSVRKLAGAPGKDLTSTDLTGLQNL
jgi:hypothetical protein